MGFLELEFRRLITSGVPGGIPEQNARALRNVFMSGAITAMRMAPRQTLLELELWEAELRAANPDVPGGGQVH